MRLFCQDVSFKVDAVKAQTIETVLEGTEGAQEQERRSDLRDHQSSAKVELSNRKSDPDITVE